MLGVVEQVLWEDIDIPTSTKQATLALAAREASTSSRVGVSCQCKGWYSTKRCRCYREDKQCSVHCRREYHECGNLSGLAIRTEMTLVAAEAVIDELTVIRIHAKSRHGRCGAGRWGPGLCFLGTLVGCACAWACVVAGDSAAGGTPLEAKHP